MKFRVYDNVKKKYSKEDFYLNPDGVLMIVVGSTFQDGDSFEKVEEADSERYTVEKGITVNGVDIYAGDVVERYDLKRYTQQSFAELPPEIDELYLKKVTDKVIEKNGAMILESGVWDDLYGTISFNFGFETVDGIKDCIFGDDRKEIYTDEEMMCDCEGTEINESVLGIKATGTIHDKEA